MKIIILITAFHRISYKKSPPNIDLWCHISLAWCDQRRLLSHKGRTVFWRERKSDQRSGAFWNSLNLLLYSSTVGAQLNLVSFQGDWTDWFILKISNANCHSISALWKDKKIKVLQLKSYQKSWYWFPRTRLCNRTFIDFLLLRRQLIQKSLQKIFWLHQTLVKIMQ